MASVEELNKCFVYKMGGPGFKVTHFCVESLQKMRMLLVILETLN